MVKPPRTMQPEAVNLKKSGRDVQKAFQDDSFHNYMARKIDMQRQQFGLLLPPSPIPDGAAPTPRDTAVQSPKRPKTIRFAPETLDHQRPDATANAKKRKKSKKDGVNHVLKRLKKRHGKGVPTALRGKDEAPHRDELDKESPAMAIASLAPLPHADVSLSKVDAQTDSDSCPVEKRALKHRSDLFLTGVVVLVNGYTEPDTETLQRMLHKHGGDLERYETSRVTHIIAENLSFAKAKMYKRQRNARPVCKPTWIVDCVRSGKLLPIIDYIIADVKDDGAAGTKSVSLFFQTDAPSRDETSRKYPKDDESRAKDTSGAESKDSSKCAHHAPDDEFVTAPCEHDDSVVPDEGTVPLVEKQIDVSTTSSKCPTDQRYIKGRVRTVGTDPNFLDSFFAASRLSFIGSYKQRARPTSKLAPQAGLSSERFVFHVDMDCFFAAVALRNYPEYRDKPVAISHLGEKRGDGGNSTVYVTSDSTSECATCNYPARKFGIKKGMFLGQARALCPGLVILAYDFDGYEEVSDAVSAILDRYASENTGYVEHVSCDEAYVQFQIQSTDGTPANTLAAELAESIRTEIFEVTQCTATVGVGKNKLLAKLATDHAKPNRSFVVGDHRCLLRPMNLRDLHGIGHRMGRKLAEEDLVTVQDIFDLGSSGESELCRVLGPALGKKIFGFCHGKDDRSIQPAARKTIGAECSYGVRFDGPYGVEHMIEGLCKEVQKRMEHVGVQGSKVTLKLKQRKPGAPPPPKFLGHGSCYSLSKSSDTQSGGVTRDWERFYEVAVAMFMEMKVEKDDVRGMGIVISKLVEDDSIETSPKKTNGVADWLGRQPQKVTNSVQDDPPAIELVALDESDDDSVIDLSHEAGPMQSVFHDIALPDLSQIHMSQVNALPTPLKEQILSKMADARSSNSVLPTDDGHSRDARFRQTDVKRMLQLASVKSGVSKVQSERGKDISLTQLECLPLEMQLQVANDDWARVGALSPEKKSARPLVNVSNERRSPTSEASRNVKRPAKATQNSTMRQIETAFVRPHLFRDDTRPLTAFMDDDPDATPDSVAEVIEFLRLCVEEQRLADLVVFLRVVHHRNDAWSTTAFDDIFAAVDEIVHDLCRVRLDKEWVTQT